MHLLVFLKYLRSRVWKQLPSPRSILFQDIGGTLNLYWLLPTAFSLEFYCSICMLQVVRLCCLPSGTLRLISAVLWVDRLLSDLIYLDVTTAEGKSHCVTAHTHTRILCRLKQGEYTECSPCHSNC